MKISPSCPNSRVIALLTALLLFAAALTSPTFARGSFGGGGRSFGGGGFGGGRSFGGGFFGGGSSRPSFTPAPRPSFTPAPPPMPHSAPMSSFGRTGSVGTAASNGVRANTAGGGSFGRAGAIGTRSFTSTSSHSNSAAGPGYVSHTPSNAGASPRYMSSTHYIGTPYVASYYHPYYYGGRPVNVFFTGGFGDYSYGYYGHPYYAYYPWSPVFYTNPPIYSNGSYISGGFSWLNLLLGIIFWLIVLIVVWTILRAVLNNRRA